MYWWQPYEVWFVVVATNCVPLDMFCTELCVTSVTFLPFQNHETTRLLVVFDIYANRRTAVSVDSVLRSGDAVNWLYLRRGGWLVSVDQPGSFCSLFTPL